MKNRILNIYITKKFFFALTVSLIGFIFIYIITNLFENIGYFVDRKASIGIILKYYLLFSPKIIVLLMPLATLMGIYFSLGLITKHNEVLALRGLGISPFRIYKPIFMGGALVSIIVLAFNVSLIPKSKRLLKEFKKEKLDKVQGITKYYARDINYITDTGQIVNIKRLSADKIFGMYILSYKKGKIVSRIDAGKATWKDSCWTLHNVYIRNFTEEGITFETKDKEIIKEFDTPPGILAKSKYNPMNLEFSELLRYTKKLEKSGQKSNRERIELLERVSYPFVNFILLFFGCPLALEVKRRGLLFGFGLGILSAFTFWGIIQLFKELGIKGNLTPSLSILIPDLLFLSLGLYFLLKKESF